MSDRCREVREWLEDGRDPAAGQVAAHLSHCPECGAHRALLASLGSLQVGEVDSRTVEEILVELPAVSWQRRQWRAWLPALTGSAMIATGLVTAGGVPAVREPLSLVPALGAALAAGVLDVTAALRGGSDAARSLLAAGGAWFVAWLTLTALGGSLAVRALVRRGR